MHCIRKLAIRNFHASVSVIDMLCKKYRSPAKCPFGDLAFGKRARFPFVFRKPSHRMNIFSDYTLFWKIMNFFQKSLSRKIISYLLNCLFVKDACRDHQMSPSKSRSPVTHLNALLGVEFDHLSSFNMYGQNVTRFRKDMFQNNSSARRWNVTSRVPFRQKWICSAALQRYRYCLCV